MAANRRKQDDKNLEVLRELITINGNKYCLDCNQRGPTYVNTTIGSFVCSKCSGMLRGITPPHRVKSISMATFTPEEIEFIRTRGNDYCRRLWLGLYEGESVNFADEQSVRDFMSDKYEKKRYYLESQSLVTNGTSVKNKAKSKVASSVNAAPLISLPAPPVKSAQTNNYNSSTKVNPTLPGPTRHSVITAHKSSKRFNHVGQPFDINVSSNNSQVPDFPVDFSNADIYCCNQFQVSNVINNNLQASSVQSAFNVPTSSINDRYAALADLDSALRQQNLSHHKPEEEVRIENKNPFQSSTNDIFANKNPFSNGGWNSTSSSVPVNPFAPATNNGNYVHSKNPFL